jgi:hypothetical protein
MPKLLLLKLNSIPMIQTERKRILSSISQSSPTSFYVSRLLYVNTYIKYIFYSKFLCIRICHIFKCLLHNLVLFNLLFKVLKLINERESIYKNNEETSYIFKIRFRVRSLRR